ncbi:MAG TPA: response regulator [Gemmatimonadaceae bacterium]|nr:response regulator [Gemmatimonadaceae bacterium]
MNSQDSAREALLVLDAELNVCAANRSFYELFRLAPEECIGKKVYEVGGKAWDPKLRTMLNAVLDAGSKSDNFELIHDKAAPGHGVLWLSAKPLPSSKSENRTILLSIEDLNARRPAEESLLAAVQHLNEFADLAGKSAHELNNLLTVMRMNAELLAPELAKHGWSGQEVKDIIGAAERAETLTRALLVSSRRAAPQPTGLDRRGSRAVLEELATEPPGPVRPNPRPRVARTGNETILLVEDEETLRKLGKRILTAAGYRVLEASDGAMALRIAAEAVGEIDLVLTDVEMPTLGGRGMVDELNELSSGIGVLFMSGYTDNEILRRGIGTAETGFLQKPFTAEALLAAVQTALGEPAPAEASA